MPTIILAISTLHCEIRIIVHCAAMFINLFFLPGVPLYSAKRVYI